jgi:hypothetical protein
MAEGEGTMTKMSQADVIEQLGRIIAAMHVAIVHPLAAYSVEALAWGQGWECANCLGMGSERFRVSHAPGCPFAIIPAEIDIPPQEGLRAQVEERILK